MYHSLPYKTKQFFIAIIKLSIIVGATYYIYNQLLNNDALNFSEFVGFLNEKNAFSPKNISFLLILTIFNWFFEILKWKTLVTFIKRISFFEALEQSLGGHTAALITPNRIGDYGAKAIYFAKQFRKRVVLLNLVGNSYQMLVTTLFGLLGLTLFYLKFEIEINTKSLIRGLTIFAIVGSFVLFGIQQSRLRIKGFSIGKILDFIKFLPKKLHLTTFLFSMLRYIIFSFQYFFILKIFGVEISYYTAMIAITSMYFLSSVVPTLALFDIVVKTSAAVFIFHFLKVDELTILCTSLLMWFLNFVIPSFFGSYFVLNFKLPKSTA